MGVAGVGDGEGSGGSTELDFKGGVEGGEVGVGGGAGVGGGDVCGVITSPDVGVEPVVPYLGVERPRYMEMVVVDDRELHA